MTVSRPFQFGEETSFTLPAQTPSAPNAPSVPAHPLDLFGNSPPPTPQVTHTDPLQGLENFRLPSSAPQTPNAEPSENQEGFLNSFLAATWSGNEIVSSFSEIRSEIAAGRDEIERGSYGVLGQDLLIEEEPLHGILSDSEARTILSRHARSFRDGLITPQTAEDFIQANLTWIESHSELWLFGAEIESRLNQCLWALTHNDASRRQDQAYVSNLPQLRERVFESARRLSARIPAWRERIQHRKEEETQRLYQNLNSTTHGSLNTLDRLRTLWRVFHLRKSQGASGEEQARLLSEMTELLPESAALKPNSPQHIGSEDENAVLWFLAQAETEVFRRSDLNENAEASLRGNLLFQILPRLAERAKNLERSQPQLALSLWSQIQKSLYVPRLASASMISNWEARHGEPRRELYFLERRLSETQHLPENPAARVQHWISLAESAKGRQDNFTALRFLTQAEQGMIRLENPETKRLSRGILVHAYLRLGFRSELQRLLRDWRERSSLAGIRRNLQGFEEWISIAQIFAENHENSEAKEIFNFARGFLSHWDLRRRIAAYPALLQLARRIENTNAPQEILDAALEDLNRAPAFRNIQERMSLIVGLAQAVSTPQEALNLLEAFLPVSQLRDFEIHSETDLQVAQNYSAQLLNLWNRIEDGATRHQIANRLRDFFNQTRVVRGNLSAENFHTLQRNFLQNRIILETQARSLSIEAVPDSHNDLSNFLLALPLQERVTHLIESARFFAEHGKETESALLLRALWNDLENTPLEQRFTLIQQISNLRTSLSANLRESIRREPEEERALQDLVENLKQMAIDAWRSVQNSANQRTGAVNGAPTCLLSRYAQAMIEVEEGNEPEALRLLQSLLRDSEQTPLESEQDRRIVVLARLMIRGSASQHFESVALILEQVLEARQAGAVEMNRLERFREKTELLNILRAIRQFQHRHSEGSAALTFREAFAQFQNDPHHQAEAQYFIEHISRLGGIETPSLMLPQGALWDFLVAADGNLQSQEGRQAFEQAIRNFTRFDADYFQNGEYQQALHTAIEILRSRSSTEEIWHLNALPGWVAGNEETGAFVRRLFSWETGLALTGMILAGAAGGMAQGWVIQMLEQGYMGETMMFEGFEALQWARMGISINNTVRAAQFVPQFFGAFGNIGGFWFGSGTWDTAFHTGGFNDIRATAVDIGPMGILLAPFATWGAIPRCLISSLVMPLTGTARHYLNLTHEGETLEHTWNVFEFLHGMAIGLGSEAVSHFNAHARGGSPEHQTLRQQREQTERIHRLVEQLSGTSHLQDLPPTPSFAAPAGGQVRRGEGEVETSPSHPYRSAASTEATAKTDSQATGHTDPHLKILQALHRLAEQIPLHELSDAQIRYAIREALKAEEAHARRNPETAEHANPFPEILHRYLEALRRGVRPEDLSRFSDFEHPFEDLIREAHIRNAARAREQALWPEFIHLERLQEEAAQRQIAEDRALFTSIDFEALKHLHIEEQRARIIAGLNPEATTLERVLHAANEWRNKYQGQIPLERVLEAFGVDLETLPRLEIFDTEGEVVSETREALREDEVQETSIVTSPDSVIPRFDRWIQASSQNQMDFRFGGNDTRVGAIHELPLLEATNPVQDAEGYVSGEVIDARDYGEPASIISSPVTPRIQRPILTEHAEVVVVDVVESSFAEVAQTPRPTIDAEIPSEVLSFREAKREQQREIQEDLLDVEGIEVEAEVSLESEPGEGRSQSSQEFHEDSFTPTANDPVTQAPLDGIRHSLRSFFEAHPIVAAAAGLIFTLGIRYLFGQVHAGISEAGGILDLLLAGNLAVAVNAIKERLSEEYVAFFAEHQDPAHLRLALDLLPQISTHLSPAQLETVMGHLYRLPNTQKARVDLITQRVRAAIRADTGEAKNILRRGLEHADPEIVADHLFAIRLLPSHLVPRDTILAVGELCRRNPNEDVVATLQAIERMRATQNLTPQENVLLAAHLTLAHRAVDTPTLRASLDALIRDRKVDAQKLQAEIARLAPTAPAEEREVAAIRARVLPAEVDAALQEMLTMAEEVSGGFSPENLREVVQKHAASVLEDYPPHYHALFAQHTERLIYFALAYELRERGEFPDPETFNAFLLFIEYKLLDDPRPAILDCGMNHAMRHLAQVQEMFVEAQAYFTEIWRASLNIAQYRNRLSDLREGAEYEETQRRIFAKRVLCLLLERRQFGDRAWEESVAHALGVALVEEGRLPTLETPAGHDDFHITVQDHLNFFDFFSRLLSQRAEQLTTVRNLDHTFPPLARYARSEARVSLRDVEALWKTHLPPRASGEKPVFMLEGVGEEWAQVERHARAGHHVVLVDMRIEAEGYYQQRSAQLRALEAAFGVSIEFHREDLLDPSPAFRERFAGRVDCIECQNIPGLGGNDTQLIDTLLKDGGLFVEFNPLEIRRDALVERAYTRVFSAENVHAVLGTFAERTVYPVGCQIEAWQKSQALRSSQDVSKPTSSIHDLRPTDMTDENLIGVIGLIPNSPKIQGPHNARARETIQAAAQRPGTPITQLLILGAGPCRDIPVEALVASGRDVKLQDLFALEVTATREKFSPTIRNRVTLELSDAYGGILFDLLREAFRLVNQVDVTLTPEQALAELARLLDATDFESMELPRWAREAKPGQMIVSSIMAHQAFFAVWQLCRNYQLNPNTIVGNIRRFIGRSLVFHARALTHATRRGARAYFSLEIADNKLAYVNTFNPDGTTLERVAHLFERDTKLEAFAPWSIQSTAHSTPMHVEAVVLEPQTSSKVPGTSANPADNNGSQSAGITRATHRSGLQRRGPAHRLGRPEQIDGTRLTIETTPSLATHLPPDRSGILVTEIVSRDGTSHPIELALPPLETFWANPDAQVVAYRTVRGERRSISLRPINVAPAHPSVAGSSTGKTFEVSETGSKATGMVVLYYTPHALTRQAIHVERMDPGLWSTLTYWIAVQAQLHNLALNLVQITEMEILERLARSGFMDPNEHHVEYGLYPARVIGHGKLGNTPPSDIDFCNVRGLPAPGLSVNVRSATGRTGQVDEVGARQVTQILASDLIDPVLAAELLPPQHPYVSAQANFRTLSDTSEASIQTWLEAAGIPRSTPDENYVILHVHHEDGVSHALWVEQYGNLKKPNTLASLRNSLARKDFDTNYRLASRVTLVYKIAPTDVETIEGTVSPSVHFFTIRLASDLPRGSAERLFVSWLSQMRELFPGELITAPTEPVGALVSFARHVDAVTPILRIGQFRNFPLTTLDANFLAQLHRVGVLNDAQLQRLTAEEIDIGEDVEDLFSILENQRQTQGSSARSTVDYLLEIFDRYPEVFFVRPPLKIGDISFVGRIDARPQPVTTPPSHVPRRTPQTSAPDTTVGTTRATHRHGLQRRGPAHKLARPENEPAGRGTATTPSSHQAIPISTRQKLRRLFIVRAGKLAEINPEIRDLPDTIFNEACERACLEYKLENGNFEQHALRIFEKIVFEIIWPLQKRVHRVAPSSLARQTREAAQKPTPAAATPPPPPEPLVKVKPRAPVVDAPPRPNGEEGDRRFLRSLEALDTRKYQALYVEERLAHEQEIFAILRFYPAEHVLSRRAKGVLAQTHWEFFEREARRKTSATNQRRAGIDTEDLIQEAALIMLEKAIEGFEPERGNLFATYLEAWVFAAQSRHVKNMGRTVRIPVYLYDLFPKVRHLEAIGKTDREICKELKISQETLEQLRIHRQDTSFSADLPRQSDPERDTRNFYALIPMSETFDPAQNQSYQSLQRALEKIPPRQAEVFVQRFVEGRTLADIAKNQPNGRVTPQRIQDIQTRAIKNLRKILRNEVDADTRRIIDGLIRTNARRSASRKDSSDAPSPGTSANSRANDSRPSPATGTTRATHHHTLQRRSPAHWLSRPEETPVPGTPANTGNIITTNPATGTTRTTDRTGLQRRGPAHRLGRPEQLDGVRSTIETTPSRPFVAQKISRPEAFPSTGLSLRGVGPATLAMATGAAMLLGVIGSLNAQPLQGKVPKLIPPTPHTPLLEVLAPYIAGGIFAVIFAGAIWLERREARLKQAERDRLESIGIVRATLESSEHDGFFPEDWNPEDRRAYLSPFQDTTLAPAQALARADAVRMEVWARELEKLDIPVQRKTLGELQAERLDWKANGAISRYVREVPGAREEQVFTIDPTHPALLHNERLRNDISLLMNLGEVAHLRLDLPYSKHSLVVLPEGFYAYALEHLFPEHSVQRVDLLQSPDEEGYIARRRDRVAVIYAGLQEQSIHGGRASGFGARRHDWGHLLIYAGFLAVYLDNLMIFYDSVNDAVSTLGLKPVRNGHAIYEATDVEVFQASAFREDYRANLVSILGKTSPHPDFERTFRRILQARLNNNPCREAIDLAYKQARILVAQSSPGNLRFSPSREISGIILNAQDYEVVPWANGKGESYVIAASPAHALRPGDAYQYRLALAPVHPSTDAENPWVEFSHLPEVDRSLVIVEGGPIEIRHNGFAGRNLQWGEVYHFSGEDKTEVRLDQGSIRDLGLMTRGNVRAKMRTLPVDRKDTRINIEEGESFIYCARGQCNIQISSGKNFVLNAGETLNVNGVGRMNLNSSESAVVIHVWIGPPKTPGSDPSASPEEASGASTRPSSPRLMRRIGNTPVRDLSENRASNDNATPWGHPPLAPAMPAIDIAAGDGFTQAHSPYTPNAALLHEGTQAGVLQFRTRENADRPRAATRDPKASGDTTKGNAHSSGQGSGQQKQSGRHRANPPGPQTHTRNVQRDIAALHRDVDRVYAYLLEWFRTPGEFDLRQDLPDLARHIAETWPEEKIQIQIATGIMGAEHAAFPQMLEHLRRAREIEAAPSSAPSIILDLGPIAPANSAVLREVLHAPAQTLPAPARVPLLARHGGGLKIALEQALPAPLRAEARPLVEAILLDAQATDEPSHRYTQAIHAWVTRFRHALRSALHDPERIVAYLEGRRGVLTPEDRIEIPQVLLYLVGDLTRVSDAELSPLPIDPETLRRDFETAVLAREGEQTAYVLMQTLYGHESMDAVDAHFGGNTSPRHRTLLAVRDYFRTLYGPHLKRLRVTPEPSETAPSNQTRQELPTSNPVLASTGRSQKPFRALLARLDSTGIATAEESHRLYVSSKLPGTNGHSYRTLRTVSETAILARLREMLETDPALAKLEGGIVDDAFDRAYTTYDLSTQDFQAHAVRVFEEMVRAALPAREERADVPPEPPPPPAAAVVAERSPTLPPPPLPAALEPVVTRAEEVSRVHSPVSSEIDSSIRRVAATATHASYASVLLHEGEAFPAGVARAFEGVAPTARCVIIELTASVAEMKTWPGFREQVEGYFEIRPHIQEVRVIRIDGSAIVFKRNREGKVERWKVSREKRPWLEHSRGFESREVERLCIKSPWSPPREILGYAVESGNNPIKNIGELLQRIVAARSESDSGFQRELTAFSGNTYTLGLVSNYINRNSNVTPDIPILTDLARFLGVDPRHLIYLAMLHNLTDAAFRTYCCSRLRGPLYADNFSLPLVKTIFGRESAQEGFGTRLLVAISDPDGHYFSLPQISAAIGISKVTMKSYCTGVHKAPLAIEEKLAAIYGNDEHKKDDAAQKIAAFHELARQGFPIPEGLVRRIREGGRSFIRHIEKAQRFVAELPARAEDPHLRLAYVIWEAALVTGETVEELTVSRSLRRHLLRVATNPFENTDRFPFDLENFPDYLRLARTLEVSQERLLWALAPNVETANKMADWAEASGEFNDLVGALRLQASRETPVIPHTQENAPRVISVPAIPTAPSYSRVLLEPTESLENGLARSLRHTPESRNHVRVELVSSSPDGAEWTNIDRQIHAWMRTRSSMEAVEVRSRNGALRTHSRHANKIEIEALSPLEVSSRVPTKHPVSNRHTLWIKTPWQRATEIAGYPVDVQRSNFRDFMDYLVRTRYGRSPAACAHALRSPLFSVSDALIKLYAHRANTVPKMEFLQRLAEVLDVDVRDLIDLSNLGVSHQELAIADYVTTAEGPLVLIESRMLPHLQRLQAADPLRQSFSWFVVSQLYNLERPHMQATLAEAAGISIAVIKEGIENAGKIPTEPNLAALAVATGHELGTVVRAVNFERGTLSLIQRLQGYGAPIAETLHITAEEQARLRLCVDHLDEFQTNIRLRLMLLFWLRRREMGLSAREAATRLGLESAALYETRIVQATETVPVDFQGAVGAIEFLSWLNFFRKLDTPQGHILWALAPGAEVRERAIAFLETTEGNSDLIAALREFTIREPIRIQEETFAPSGTEVQRPVQTPAALRPPTEAELSILIATQRERLTALPSLYEGEIDLPPLGHHPALIRVLGEETETYADSLRRALVRVAQERTHIVVELDLPAQALAREESLRKTVGDFLGSHPNTQEIRLVALDGSCQVYESSQTTPRDLTPQERGWQVSPSLAHPHQIQRVAVKSVWHPPATLLGLAISRENLQGNVGSLTSFVRAFRQKLGITQAQLADVISQVGSRRYATAIVAHTESGRNTTDLTDPDFVKDLARLAGIDARDLAYLTLLPKLTTEASHRYHTRRPEGPIYVNPNETGTARAIEKDADQEGISSHLIIHLRDLDRPLDSEVFARLTGISRTALESVTNAGTLQPALALLERVAYFTGVPRERLTAATNRQRGFHPLIDQINTALGEECPFEMEYSLVIGPDNGNEPNQLKAFAEQAPRRIQETRFRWALLHWILKRRLFPSWTQVNLHRLWGIIPQHIDQFESPDYTSPQTHGIDLNESTLPRWLAHSRRLEASPDELAWVMGRTPEEGEPWIEILIAMPEEAKVREALYERTRERVIEKTLRIYEEAGVAAYTSQSPAERKQLDKQLIAILQTPGLSEIRERRVMRILFKWNRSYIQEIAYPYARRYKMDVEDLISVGRAALWECAKKKFDLNSDNLLWTYASYWVTQKIQREAQDTGRAVRFPVHFQDALRKLDLVEKRRRTEGLSMDDREICEEMGFSIAPDDLADSLKRLALLREKRRETFASTDAPLWEDGEETLQDINDFGTSTDHLPIDELERTELQHLREDLFEAIRSELTDRERVILNQRLLGEATLEEIGRQLGITRERVRQIETKLKKKIKDRLRLRHHVDSAEDFSSHLGGRTPQTPSFSAPTRAIIIRPSTNDTPPPSQASGAFSRAPDTLGGGVWRWRR